MSLKESKFGVNIVKVVSPVEFLALKSSRGCPIEEDITYTYERLDVELNEHYDNWTESTAPGELPYQPTKIGELVAVWEVERRRWYRGRIKKLCARQQFREATVHLIDEARDVRLKAQGLRCLQPEFARFPFRSVTLLLDKLAPITLQVEIGDSLAVNNRVADKWDDHALTFVQRTIEGYSRFNFETRTTLLNGSHVGQLYMLEGGRNYVETCLNDLLVENKYATCTEHDIIDLVSPSSVGSASLRSPDIQGMAPGPPSSVGQPRGPNEIEELRRRTDEMLLKDESSTGNSRKSAATNCKLSHFMRMIERCDAAESRTMPLNDKEDFVSVVMKHHKGMAFTSDAEVTSCEDESSTSSLRRSQPGPSFTSKPDKCIETPTSEQGEKCPELRKTCVEPGISQPERGVKCKDSSSSSTSLSSSFESNNVSEGNVHFAAKVLGRGRAALRHNQQTQQHKLNLSQEFDSLPKLNGLPCSSKGQNPGCVQKMDVNENSLLRQSRLPLTKAEAKYEDHVDILRLGNDIPEQTSFSSIDLDDWLLENLKALKLNPTLANLVRLWPAMLQWRDVVQVAAPGDAKTVSYLLPLIWMVMGREGRLYDRLPDAKPTVLVLCSSWRVAVDVHDVCAALLHTFDPVQVRLLHSGTTKESSFDFGRNYHILVATPMAFLRLVDGPGVTLAGFERISHLVLNDADNLLEEFPDQMEEIVIRYREAVSRRRKQADAPQQIVLSSGTWTAPLCKFIIKHMRDVLFYCESFFEAWVYSGVATQLHLMQPEQRLEAVIELLEPRIASKDMKIVVCASKENDVSFLGKVLNRTYPSTLVANSNMSCQQLAEVRSRWNSLERFAILVVNDSCLKELAILDADWIIHYDIPRRSRSYFSIRFMCLMNHARKVNYLTKPIRRVSPECAIHVLVTSDCYYQSHGLIKLMQRLGQKIPAGLKALGYGFYEGKETNKEDERTPNSILCRNIKSFGRCHNPYWCKERHLLVESLDAPPAGHPVDSNVQVLVTQVHNVNQYFGRVLRSKSESGPWMDWSEGYVKLKEDLTFHFAKPSSQIRLVPEEIKIGDVGAYQDDDGMWHRVQVVDKPQGKFADVPQLKVMYLDEGNVEKIHNSKLMLLPDNLREQSSLLREIFLCNVAPPDKEREWFATQIEKVKELLETKLILGKVALSAGNTLWLNPVICITLTALQTAVREFHIASRMIKDKLAVENPDHFTKLTEFFQRVFPVVSNPPTTSSPEIRPHCSQPQTSEGTLPSQQSTIVEPHTTPDVDQPTANVTEVPTNHSKVALSLPKVAQSVPKVATNLPSVATKLDVAHNVSNLASGVPEVAVNIPNVATNVSSLATNVFNVEINVPKVASDVPNVASRVSKVITNLPNIEPSIPNVSPNFPKFAPNVSVITPKMHNVEPTSPALNLLETPCATPKQLETAPQLASPAGVSPPVNQPVIAVTPRPESSLTSRGPSVLLSPDVPQAKAAAPATRHVQLVTNQLERVYVSCLENPHLFYVQKVRPYEKYLKLMRSLEKRFSHFDVVSADELLSRNSRYCAFSFERRDRHLYGRGEILSVESDGTIRVLNSDTGDEDFVEASAIRRLDDRYLRLRFQGIPCRLNGVESVTGDGCWEDRVGDRMWELTRDRERCNKQMVVKALELVDQWYTVELFDGSGDVNVSVAETLQREGLLKYVSGDGEKVENDNVEPNLNEEQELVSPESPNVDNRVTPKVEWSDRRMNIRLKIKVGGIKDFKWVVKDNRVHFRTTVGDMEYELKETFYAALRSTPPVSRSDPYCLVSTFEKVVPGEWPRLLESRVKPKWLRVDFDDIDLSSDDEKSLASYHFDVNPEAAYRVLQGVPGGMQDSSGSESGESSDEFYADSDENSDYFKL